MADKDDPSPKTIPRKDRRSGIDRRWIKAPYKGRERRSGVNRRQETGLKNQLLPIAHSPFDQNELEQLLVSTTLQLEAITRLLLKNGLVDDEELQKVLADIHNDYRSAPKK